jgi:glycosyltransferase involved in cell wall biosynthesis
MGGRKERAGKPKRLRSSEAPTAKETPAKGEIDTCTYQRFASIPCPKLTFPELSPTKKIVVLADFPLHVLTGSPFPPPAGHYATWLPQLAEAFAEEKDFEFHWLTLDPSLPEEVSIQAWGQTFHVLPSWRRGRAATLFWADRRRIQKKQGQIGPDLVHGWGNENVWGWAAVRSGGPHIFSIQGLLGFYARLGHCPMRTRLMAILEAMVLRRAGVLTAESPWTIGHVKDLYGRNDVRMVEYGVPQEFFDAEYAPDTTNPYAVMIGTADFRKGVDFAIELFSRPALAHLRLKVIGGVTPFGEKWKKISPANVEWSGRKTQSEIIRLMAGATCLVLPTRGDTGPTVAKEARVMGLPIVASPHGGHIQYVEHEKNGFVLGLEDPEPWSRAIRYLFADLARAQSMGQVSQQRQRDLLRPSETARHFLNLYSEILQAPERKIGGP